MSYDDKVPLALKREQQWFGSIIGRPIDEDSRMNPISPSGESMEEEAALHIAPSPTLRPAQRIQIYNQQYWWRLLNTLHESFPLLTRLFGYYEFNRSIGFPYLVKYPPRHWSLSLLGDRLHQWCMEEYHAEDKHLVLEAIAIDWAFSDSFTAESFPPLSVEQLAIQNGDSAIFEKTLYIQPFINLFEYAYDLFKYRIDFLKELPEHWLNHDFPELDRSQVFYYALYRNSKQDISWKKISKAEYHLLKFFKNGASLEKACEWLEDQDSEINEAASVHLQEWFQEWACRGWLSLKKV